MTLALAVDGHTYERVAIQKSIDSCNHRSPMTNKRFANLYSDAKTEISNLESKNGNRAIKGREVWRIRY